MHRTNGNHRATLENLCLKSFAKNIGVQANNTSCISKVKVFPLPLILAQQIFDFCVEEAVAVDVNKVLDYFFQNCENMQLQNVRLRNVRHADVNLLYGLVKANLDTLSEIDVRGCPVLPKKFWNLLSKSAKLETLKTTDLQIPLKCPTLKILVVDWKPHLILQRVQQHIQSSYYDHLFENVLENLVCLDISWCPWSKRLRSLGNAKQLEALFLRNCDISNLVNDIVQLKQLRTLDVSVGLEQELHQDFNGKYSDPDYILAKLLTSLSKLEYLDISGTNLIPTNESSSELLAAFDSRRSMPLKFLGMYSPSTSKNPRLGNLPAIRVAGNEPFDAVLEAIKRNVDMPKTMRNQLCTLNSIEGSSADMNFLLDIQIKMFKNLRAKEHFRFWALKCLHYFLDQNTLHIDQINEETRKELFHVLNRLTMHSRENFNKVSELSLKLTFQIFLKLLPVDKLVDEEIFKEIMHLGKFLLSLNRTHLVYFKTEAIIFRLLHRLSQEPFVCSYLSENSAVLNCFEFFKYIQVYLGFSLRVPQTSDIVTLTWKSILAFMLASQNGINDFIKHRGLSWMYAHLSWFSYDEGTRRDLRRIFMDILNILEASVVNIEDNISTLSRSSLDLVYKVKEIIRIAV